MFPIELKYTMMVQIYLQFDKMKIGAHLFPNVKGLVIILAIFATNTACTQYSLNPYDVTKCYLFRAR